MGTARLRVCGCAAARTAFSCRLAACACRGEERDVVLGTAVGEPVPAKHAFDADDQLIAERGDRCEQGVEVAAEVLIEYDTAVVGENAGVHGPSVQVDAAVESALAVVKAHGKLLGCVGA